MSTVSITWIVPFDASMSVITTRASLIITVPPSTVMLTIWPWAVAAESRVTTADAFTSPDDEGLFYRVYRWEEALCMGTPGMLKAVANIPKQLAGCIGSLFVAGDYMRVPSVNGVLSSGCSAATEVADLLESRAN